MKCLFIPISLLVFVVALVWGISKFADWLDNRPLRAFRPVKKSDELKRGLDD